jgi:hypothetical protein
MKWVTALVKMWGGATKGEITVAVPHFWDVLHELMDEGMIPDEPFVIEVRAGDPKK